jgi:hypothetical protein
MITFKESDLDPLNPFIIQLDNPAYVKMMRAGEYYGNCIRCDAPDEVTQKAEDAYMKARADYVITLRQQLCTNEQS